MRIMQMVSGMGVNGAVLQCMALAKALCARGHEVLLVCRPDSWTSAQPVVEGLEIVTNPLRRWPLYDVRRAAGWIRERKIDLVHTHQSRAHVFGLLLRWFAKTPCVATAHARHLQPHWRWNDHVLANSEATYRFHRRWNLVPARRIQIVHYLLDFDRFAVPRPHERCQLREQWQARPGELLAGIIGDIIPRKGQLHAVQAWAEVARVLPASKLVMVGAEKNAHYARMTRLAAERLGVADRIVWAGYCTDIPAVMHALDVCVSAAVEEALGLTVLEAMAASRAVVATRVGGVPENVIPNKTGLLVPPRSPRELAQAVIELLSDDAWREACGRQGRELVRRKYDAERQLQQIEQIYEQVVHGAVTQRV